jgi:uncharacterized membrane protein
VTLPEQVHLRALILNPTLMRRVVHAILYEIGALLILIPVMSAILNTGVVHFGLLALMLSVCAVACNMLYQHGFEWLEARFALRRTVRVRIVHALGFELFFTLVALPLTAWWLAMSLLDAFLLDLGLTAFFLLYTFCFNWLYDLGRKRLRG